MKISRALNNALRGSARVAQGAIPQASAQSTTDTPHRNTTLRKDIKFNKLSQWPDLGAFYPRLDVAQGEDPLKAGLPSENEILEEERQKAIKRMYEGGELDCSVLLTH